MHESRNDRIRLQDFARKIEPASTWADISLPDQQLRVLRELAASAAQLSHASADPQSETKASSDRGVIALFAGPDGAAKTMAAEVLARDLNQQLYRIDLAQVVSKYIGETEKNLSRVFTDAPSGAILLFDEADSLFGKRTEVKDSHDRYANLEFNYFLQRAEQHRGLVILAAKSSQNLEPALPRIHFTVQFSLPGAV